MFTVISESQECKLKIVIACFMCSNEVCAKCHVSTEDVQGSQRLKKVFIGVGGEKDTKNLYESVCKVRLGKIMAYLGGGRGRG